jgi:hypothetical protein
MKRKQIIERDDTATASGRYAPPRKLLKAAGGVEMWQVEIPGQRWRASLAIRYEVTGGPAGKMVFNRPHDALDYFRQIAGSA